VHLVEPHLHAVVQDVAHVGQVAGVGLPGEVLAGVLEGVGVVAAVVHHVALADVQGGQVGQLIIPLHGGHAAGGIVAGIIPTGDVVPLVVVRVDKDPLVVVVDVDQLGIPRTAAVPPVAVATGDVGATVADVPRTVVGGLGQARNNHQNGEHGEFHIHFDSIDNQRESIWWPDRQCAYMVVSIGSIGQPLPPTQVPL